VVPGFATENRHGFKIVGTSTSYLVAFVGKSVEHSSKCKSRFFLETTKKAYTVNIFYTKKPRKGDIKRHSLHRKNYHFEGLFHQYFEGLGKHNQINVSLVCGNRFNSHALICIG
jgi:hypothetical protein